MNRIVLKCQQRRNNLYNSASWLLFHVKKYRVLRLRNLETFQVSPESILMIKGSIKNLSLNINPFSALLHISLKEI